MNDFKLINGDCLIELKNIPDKSVNLVLIDPPYNIGKDKWDKWKSVDDYVKFMGKVFKEVERVLKDSGSFYFFHNDFLQIVELQNWINKNTKFKFKQLITWNKMSENFKNYGFVQQRLSVNMMRNYYNGFTEYILYYTFQDENGLNKIKLDINNFQSLKQYSKELQDFIGLKLKDINKILGHRRAEHFFYHSSTQWGLCVPEVYQMLIDNFNIDNWEKFRSYESLKQEYENERYTFNNCNVKENFRGNSNVWIYPPEESRKHITQKPLDILKHIILTSSNKNDTVLDCFMGSGSTGVACKHLNRKFIGIEISQEYFEIAKNRIDIE